MSEITPEQRQYIIEHLNDRPRTEVARAAGVDISTVYRLVREYGGDLRYDLSRRNPWYVEIVKKHYADMAGNEIDRMYGVGKGRANKIAAKLGLTHSPETWERINRKIEKNRKLSQTKENRMKAARTWKISFRIDERRVWEGKSQFTKLKVAQISHRAYKRKWHLIRYYGYIESEEPYTLLYDKNTQRRIGERRGGGKRYYNEEYFSNNFGLIFKPLNENDLP